MIMNRRNVLCALPSRYGLGSTFPLGRTAHSHGAHGGLTVVTPLNAGPSTRIVGVQLVVTSSATASMRPRWRPRRPPEHNPARELGGEDPRENGTDHFPFRFHKRNCGFSIGNRTFARWHWTTNFRWA